MNCVIYMKRYRMKGCAMFLRLTLVLAFFTVVCSVSLKAVYDATAAKYEDSKYEAQERAVRNIFFDRKDADGKSVKYEILDEKIEKEIVLKGSSSPSKITVFKILKNGESNCYALLGEGIGFNKSVPLQVMVGFEEVAESSFRIIGFKVIKHEETPGIGDSIKASKPKITWLDRLRGNPPCSVPDLRTNFQRQFDGKEASTLKSKITVDAISGATVTTDGLIYAIQDADRKLLAALYNK